MNDAAIKNFCIDARRTLLEEVAQRLAWWGIEEGHDGRPQSRAQGAQLDGRVLSADEQRQCSELLRMAGNDRKSMDALIERGAYTWFNRLVAIRYMELNGRLPGRVRMLSADDGSFEPQCLREALDMRLTGLDQARVLELRQSGDDEGLFRYLLLLQCDELAHCMPAVFEPIGAAMELLLPAQLLRSGSILDRLVTQIPEGDWREGVQIVGWMYQYYISERKDEVFASFKKGKKAERDAIAPATQLFTPDWIVQYLVQNSLGRLWMLARPESNLASKMPYYISPEGETETPRTLTSPEELRVCDPACGSGHMLVYAFELLMEMYLESGFTARDAAQLIVERNLQGIEIDERATALASFAVTMKACEYDSRFLRRGVTPQVTCLRAVPFTDEELELLPHVKAERGLADTLMHLDECGSLFVPTSEQIAALKYDTGALNQSFRLGTVDLPSKLALALEQCKLLSSTYDVVVANPPYMGGKNMNKWLLGYVKTNYPDSKGDLCTCFIDRGFDYIAEYGYSAFVTMDSWMFLSNTRSLREKILNSYNILSLVYMNHMVMRIAFDTSATVFSKNKLEIDGYYTRINYSDLSEFGKPRFFPMHEVYRRRSSVFTKIPNEPIAFWATDSFVKAFDAGSFSSYGEARSGLQTGDNDRFLKYWQEVSYSQISFANRTKQQYLHSGLKWVPQIKGGEYRKWYGNFDYVLNWLNDGEEIRHCPSARLNAMATDELFFKEGLTWSHTTSGVFGARFLPSGSLFNVEAPTYFTSPSREYYSLGLLNSTVIQHYLDALSPSLHYLVGSVMPLPVIENNESKSIVEGLVKESIVLSRSDWDSFEISWDFKRSPLV